MELVIIEDAAHLAAQRSASAAREIKSLITASVEQVEQGNALVSQAGTTMHEVVTSVRRVSDIVAGIGAVSTERNAALVEQSAAAAESLKHQADQLVRTVSVFRLAA